METPNQAPASDENTAPPAGSPVVFTAAAVTKVRSFLDSLEEAKGKHLRIFVQGGGCSGFEYGFTFDERKPNDIVVAQDGIEVLLDLFSKPYLEGCEVDYKESLMGSGFSVQNPNAVGTCGCGHSFSA
ncbi:MAG: iron-sulfur cluster insertion protein ErpA [Acidobacteria bacterium]|nr:iron-sulfur cluster insertion protein ErpA [Acidobacteriota bacterium]